MNSESLSLKSNKEQLYSILSLYDENLIWEFCLKFATQYNTSWSMGDYDFNVDIALRKENVPLLNVPVMKRGDFLTTVAIKTPRGYIGISVPIQETMELVVLLTRFHNMKAFL